MRVIRLAILAALVLMACEPPIVINGREWIDPDELDFDLRRVGRRHSKIVTLTNIGPTDATVRRVRFEPDVAAYKARIEPDDTLTGYPLVAGLPVPVTINFEPHQAGSYATTMIISVGNVEVRLGLLGDAVESTSDILLDAPNPLEFGVVPVGDRVNEEIGLHNIGEDALQFEHIGLDGFPMPAEIGDSTFFLSHASGTNSPLFSPIRAGEKKKFSVHFLPTSEGAVAQELQMQFGVDQLVRLPLRGTGADQGTLACAPMEHDFGAVPRGGLAEVEVQCTAAGGVVVLDAVNIYNGDESQFSLYGAPGSGQLVSPSAPVRFRVVFGPSGSLGPHSAEVQVEPRGSAPAVVLGFTGEVTIPSPLETQITARLSWDLEDADLDLHLVRFGRAPFGLADDCFFRSKNPDWGETRVSLDNPYLDVDDTSGPGPETINLVTARETQYDVYVHYYRARNGAQTAMPTVDISLFRQLVATRTLPLPSCGRIWHVGRVTVNGQAGTGQFMPSNLVTDASDQADCLP